MQNYRNKQTIPYNGRPSLKLHRSIMGFAGDGATVCWFGVVTRRCCIHRSYS
uniref:Uncharacterized protein n=1 Tax=Solanum lycopersicum TaxID=4081 RepID=A0A3Q7IFQ5_SOLLC